MRGLRRWLAVGSVAVIAVLYYRPVHAYLDTRHTLAARSAEIRALEARKQALEQRVVLTESGGTIVRLARRLGLVKPGERLFIINDIAAWRHSRAPRRSR